MKKQPLKRLVVLPKKTFIKEFEPVQVSYMDTPIEIKREIKQVPLKPRPMIVD